MPALGSLVVQLALEYGQYTAALGKTEQAALAHAKRVQDAMDGIKSKAANVAMAVAGGIAAAFTVNAFQRLIGDAISTGAALHDLSIQTGATVESLSGLAEIGKYSNVGLEQIGSTMNKLAANLAGATEESAGTSAAIRALGLDLERFKQMKPEDQMQAVAGALDGFQDGASKGAVMMALFGKEGAKLLPFMKDLATAGELQARITTEQAAAADNLDDNLLRLRTANGVLAKEVATSMIPALDDAVVAMLEVTNGTGGLRDQLRGLAADGSIDQWTRDAITGLSYVIDIVQGVGGAVGVIGVSFKAVFDDIATGLKTMVLASIAVKNLDFEGAMGVMNRGVDEFSARSLKVKQTLDDLWNPRLRGEQMREAMLNNLIRSMAELGDESEKTKPKLDFRNEAGKSEQEINKYTSALQNLEQQLGGLNEQTAEEKLLYQLTAGSLKDLTQAHKDHLVEVAKEVDLKKQIIAQTKRNMEAAQADLDMQKEVDDVMRDRAIAIEKVGVSMFAYVQGIEDETFAMTASTEAARERNAVRELEKLGLTEASEKWAEYKKRITDATEVRDATRDQKKAQVDMWQSAEKAAHDTWTAVARDGVNAFEQIGKTLQSAVLDLLYQMTVKRWFIDISTSVSGASVSQSAFGSASTASSLYNAGSFLNSNTGWLGQAAASSAAYGSVLAGGSQQAAMLAAQTAGMEVGMTQSAMLAAQTGEFGMAGLAATAEAAGTTMAGSFLAAIPGWGWAALAALAVINFNSKNWETKYGGAFDNTGADGTVRKLYGPGTGGEFPEQFAQKSLSATTKSIDKLLERAGSSLRTSYFSAGAESSQEGEAFSYAGGRLTAGGAPWGGMGGRGGLEFGQIGSQHNRGNATPQEAMAALVRELNQSTLQALQAATDIPKAISSRLAGVDIDKLSGDALAALNATVAKVFDDVDNLRAAAQLMPFESLRSLSFAAASGLIEFAGGLEALSGNLNTYYQNFYNAEEQRAQTVKNITATLNAAGATLSEAQVGSATREQFRQVVEGIDTTTDAGQRMYAAMMSVAGAFAQITPASQAAAEGISSVASVLRAHEDAVNDARTTLADAYQRESSELQTTIDKMYGFSKSLLAFKDSLLLGNLSTLSTEDKYRAAKDLFDRTRSAAMAGDESAMGELQNVAQQFLQASRDYNASTGAYERDFSAVQSALATSASAAMTQAGLAQAQLTTLQASVSGLITVNTSVLSVREAILELATAQRGYASASGSGGPASGSGGPASGSGGPASGSGGTTQSAGVISTNVINGVAAGYAPSDVYALAQADANITGTDVSHVLYSTAKQMGASMADVDTYFGWTPGSSAAWADANNLPRFAAGGIASGLFSAGEQGTEIMYSPAPVRVLSHSQSNAAVIDGGEVSKLLREIITELRADKVQRGAVAEESLQRLDIVADKLDGTRRTLRTLEGAGA